MKTASHPTEKLPDYPSTDDLTPLEVAEKTVKIAIKKTNLKSYQTLVLAFMGGVFIALGSMFSTALSANGTSIAYGLNSLIKGLAFTLGLVLVLVAGAELFTGNMLMIVAFLDKKIKLSALLRNWGIVYVGNFIGALVTAIAIASSKYYTFGNGAIAVNIFSIANTKISYGFFSALLLGIFCNFCVCVAVWMAYSARSTGSKIAAMLLPIIALVAGGFEHSIANMYFIPVAFFIRLFNPAFVNNLGTFENLTLPRFFLNNLIPVTIGNMIGGAFFIGYIYWFAYLRKSK